MGFKYQLQNVNMNIINKHLMSNLTKLIFGIVLIFSINNCVSQKKENSWSLSNLKGKVKSYTQYSYKAIKTSNKIKKRERTTDDHYKQIFNYNDKGYLLESLSYNEKDSLNNKFSYKYNEKGNLIELRQYELYYKPHFNIKIKKEKKTLFKYDEKENMIETIIYHTDMTIKNIIVLKYDEKGNKIEENYYNSWGLNNKYYYKYDEKGNVIEIYFQNLEQKNMTKSYFKNLKVASESKTEYKYNEKGNWIEKNVYNSDNSLINKSSAKYNDTENKIEENYYYPNNSLKNKVSVQKDEKGNIIEYAKYSSDGSFIYDFSYTYTFDNRENWTKKIKFEGEVPTTIINREYKYY